MSIDPEIAGLGEDLSRVLPEFAERWQARSEWLGPDSTACTVFTEAQRLFSTLIESLRLEERRTLLDYIEQCLASPSQDLADAAATCFLEDW